MLFSPFSFHNMYGSCRAFNVMYVKQMLLCVYENTEEIHVGVYETLKISTALKHFQMLRT